MAKKSRRIRPAKSERQDTDSGSLAPTDEEGAGGTASAAGAPRGSRRADNVAAVSTDPGLTIEDLPPVSRREAKRLLKHGRKLLKRNRKKIDERKASDVDAALDELRRALERDDQEELHTSFHRADRRLERHLGFAQKSVLREYAESIVLAVLFALLLRAFVVEAFKIPTKSMVPTLLEGDHLFVNKFAYGLRVPFTTKRLVAFGEPQRGDVVVFIFPRLQAAEYIATHGRECLDRASLEEEKDYIKRIIGLPGDTIEVVDNVIHVDGEPVSRTLLYRREVADYGFPPHRHTEVWSEEAIGDATYVTIARQASIAGYFGPTKVKDGHVFVMGDNRDNSSDSRCWGQVPIDNIKGEAMVIWWSSGPHGARWSRLFSLVD